MSAPSRRGPRLFVLLLALVLAIAACTDAGNRLAPAPTRVVTGSPRTFAMGLSSLPPELTEASYERAFALAARAGEVILIQRTPPWAEMLSGELSDDTVQSTQREIELAREHGLDVFVAIDPTDAATGRSQLAALPDRLHGAGFSNEEVQDAFLSYARYVAENYRPRYLALGVEINSYQQQHPEDFEQFVLLYHEAYEAVKQLSPATLVFPTFQLEELQGLLPAERPLPPQWYLLNRFVPRMDALAVSTYPSLAFADPAEIPGSYYAQLTSYTDRPTIIAGMGYPSEPEVASVTRTEQQQAAFLQRVLDSAQQLQMPLVVWFLSQDPTFTSDAPLGLLQHIGLLRQDGAQKAAWRVWETAARRPLAQAPGSKTDDPGR